MPDHVTKWCHLCRQADTAPRHVILQANGTIIEPHMDCCSASGDCPDGSCTVIVAHAAGKQNDELRTHILTNGEEIDRLVKEAASGN